MEAEKPEPSPAPPVTSTMESEDSIAAPVALAQDTSSVPEHTAAPAALAPDTSSVPEHSAAPAATQEAPTSVFSVTGLSSWAKSIKIPQPPLSSQSQESPKGKTGFAGFTSGLGLRLSPKSPQQDESAEATPTTAQAGVFGSLTKGLVDSSKNAVKAVQVKARHMVSQNKRRYQEGGFDLDMTYITENIIAMGFPAGDLSSGIFGYFEGFYRNHMEEVIRFFETHHKGKYKVYNLCSERLYDASLFEGTVACFPFDDHNCPPIHLISLFCQSAYSWLKEDIENVVVVHCKAGKARTGLMISSLLLFLKFFPTAEESIEYYNQKRCVDGKGLTLPSQIRYVKYFERILTYFNGQNQPARRCMIRGFRLHRCPYWIRPSITISNHNGVLFTTKKHPRTKDLMPEDFWFSAPKKGIMVFALPGEPGLTEVAGDFKVQFHDRQGDFYFWLNTTMMENRVTLTTSDLDDFDKRKLPSPGFQVEVVVVDYDPSQPPKPVAAATTTVKSAGAGDGDSTSSSANTTTTTAAKENNHPDDTAAHEQQQQPTVASKQQQQDDVFSDNESESGGGGSRGRAHKVEASTGNSAAKDEETVISTISQGVEKVVLKPEESPAKPPAAPPSQPPAMAKATADESGGGGASGMSEFKAIAADASVFSFGDDEEYESE